MTEVNSYWILDAKGQNNSVMIDCIPEDCPEKYRYFKCEFLKEEFPEDACIGLSDNFGEGGEVLDIIGTTINLTIVSEKVKEVFQQRNINDVEFLPLMIDEVGSYFILNPLSKQAIVNMDESDYRMGKIDKSQISKLRNLVLDYSQLDDNVHFFRASQFMYKQFISQELYQAFLDAGVTGLRVKQAEGYKG